MEQSVYLFIIENVFFKRIWPVLVYNGILFDIWIITYFHRPTFHIFIYNTMMFPIKKIQNLYLFSILIIKFQQYINKIENCNQYL